jgi:hypothetical protein
MRRMASSGMLRRVALVKTVVSEELSASIIKAIGIGNLGAMLGIISNRRKLRENLKSYKVKCSYPFFNKLYMTYKVIGGGNI